MKILIVSNGADNGGVGIGIKRAFDAYGPKGWKVRSVTRAQNFIGFEPDVFWPVNGDAREPDRLYREADVIHVMDKLEAMTQFPSFLGFDDKPVVLHHHGSIFRSRPQGFLDEARKRGWLQLAATFDLLRFAPDDLHWMPHPVNVEQLQALRKVHYRRQSWLKVVHTPGAGYNGTDALLRAHHEAMTWDVDVVRRESWIACMKRKAQADILFDSFDIGYGMTSVEAFAMGIPVISGADPETEARLREHLGVLPYYPATPDTIGNAVETLVSDATLRAEVAQAGLEVALLWHDEKRIVDRLVNGYELAAR